MEVTGISWSAFASGAFREGAIRGRKAGCGGTTAHSWGGRERATRGIEKERSRLRRHHSPFVGWKNEGPSVAEPRPMCGVVSGNTIGGVCLKKKLFLKNCFLGVTFNGHPTANKTPCGDRVFRLGLRIWVIPGFGGSCISALTPDRAVREFM